MRDLFNKLFAVVLTMLAGCAALAQAQHSGHNAAGINPCKDDPSLKCARSATPFFAKDGALWVVWSGGGAISVARSTDLGASFEPRIEIAQHGAFLDTGADARPQAVTDSKGNVVIAYGFFRDKNWNAQVNVSRSTDGGKFFSTPEPITNDPASQRFPNLLVDRDDRIFATWVDKRISARAVRPGEKQLGGSIAYAWSSDAGKSFVHEGIAQPNSCECCRIATDLAGNGMPVILYRAIFDRTVRDHATQTFMSPTQPGPVDRVSVDDWAIDSCPHHGPAIAISRSGVQHVAWFTQGNARTGTYYARSTDGGRTYTNPTPIGSTDRIAGRPYLLAYDKYLWRVWKEFDGKRASVHLQVTADEGLNWSDPLTVADAVGYSDHPLLVQRDGVVYLSWLTAAQGYRLIKLQVSQ